MRTALFTLLFVFIFCIANAQIVVSSADMPVAGQYYTLSTAIPSSGNGIDTMMGTNKTWDFSNLKAITQSEDTFFSKKSMPTAYQLYFFTSNLGEKAPDISFGTFSLTNVYNIYKN